MKSIKDYLHLYLGCEAAIGYDPNGISGMRIDKIVDVGLHGAFTSNSDLEKFEDVKPLLRPLSDMTGYEYHDIAMIGGCNEGDIIGTEETDTGFILTYQHQDMKLQFTYKWDSLSPEQFRYILSNHFDIFGLVEAGLAIDKTALTPKL